MKVFIPSVYPDEYEKKPEFLPPAEQAIPLTMNSKHGSGGMSFPALGSIVWCFFQNED